MQGAEIVTSGGAAVPVHASSPAAIAAIEAQTLKAMLADQPEPTFRQHMGAMHDRLSASVSPAALALALSWKRN